MSGIALRPAGNGELQVYDAGGIFDPIDGRVQGEHYSTSHFALLAAILFRETGEATFLESAKLAIDFHLRTSPNEYQPMSEWMYHWDFQNYAFVLSFELLRDQLMPEERKTWQRGLKKWRTNHRNKLINWAAMRAWAYAERRELVRSPLDTLLMKWNLRTMAGAQSPDGSFDDNPNLSRPIQYHIFTVAIVHRLWLLTQETSLKRWFDAGIDYFMPFVDPDGEFNYVGRGHRQIFGYAAAIYALEASYKENSDERCQAAADKIFEYLMRFKRGNHFPLVLNERPDEERAGWYDYHHLTVYNAFLGVWLGMAHLLNNPRSGAKAKQRTYSWASQSTQTAVISREKYFVVFTAGASEYLSEAGVTPHHLWWKGLGPVFSCPGGPTPERFGQRTPAGQEQNLFAPLARTKDGWLLPAHRAGSGFQLDGDQLRLSFDYGPFDLTREISFGADVIDIRDRFDFLEDTLFDEFRFFNLPVAIDRFSVSVNDSARLGLTSAEGRGLLILFADDLDECEALETTVSAVGKLRFFARRRTHFAVSAGEERSVAFHICDALSGEPASGPDDGVERKAQHEAPAA